MQNSIEFTRIKSDVYGNPRYACHWTEFQTDSYQQALNIAKELGGKKFDNKQYGGGIVFQSYNIDMLSNKINLLINNQ
jgi:hypothetical protein